MRKIYALIKALFIIKLIIKEGTFRIYNTTESVIRIHEKVF